MADIEIFLSVKINNIDAQISFLSIPQSDIERLAVFPLRWIRYVMFAICGAKGDLSTTPNGTAVNYEETEIANGGNRYYYRPSGPRAYVDYEALNDRITTTSGTDRRRDFRRDVIRRDGQACVITEVGEGHCEAAHLIPHSKGDKYIRKVMEFRSPGDGCAAHIDMTENGILLSKVVHSMLAKGEVALIKSPNYGLRPEDIKRFGRGDERSDYITLQWIKKPENFDPRNLEDFQALRDAGIVPRSSWAHDALENVDALFRGEGDPLPSTAILDYLYGIAAYKAWHSNHDEGFNPMKAYCDTHYAQISPASSAPGDDTEDTEDTDTPEPDDPKDRDYKPARTGKRYTTRRSALEDTMDELNMFFMYINGITPEIAAERREKEIEREERAAQEASQSKVTEWRNHMYADIGPSRVHVPERKRHRC